MPFTTDVDRESGFVHLQYSGIVDIEERLLARTEVFALIKEHGLARSLVETQNSNMLLRTEDIIRFGESFRDIDLPPGYRVACVIARGDGVDKMIELVTASEGVCIKVFLDREEAIRWLAE